MSSFDDLLAQSESALGNIESIIGKGLGIFGDVKEAVWTKQSAPVPQNTPEPVASKPAITGQTGLGGSGSVIIAAAIIGYLLIARK